MSKETQEERTLRVETEVAQTACKAFVAQIQGVIESFIQDDTKSSNVDLIDMINKKLELLSGAMLISYSASEEVTAKELMEEAERLALQEDYPNKSSYQRGRYDLFCRLQVFMSEKSKGITNGR